jgi:hypothetical protein
MNSNLLKNPLAIIVIAIVLAVFPLLFENENLLVILRLLSFALFFYAGHLFFNRKNSSKKTN